MGRKVEMVEFTCLGCDAGYFKFKHNHDCSIGRYCWRDDHFDICPACTKKFNQVYARIIKRLPKLTAPQKLLEAPRERTPEERFTNRPKIQEKERKL